MDFFPDGIALAALVSGAGVLANSFRTMQTAAAQRAAQREAAARAERMHARELARDVAVAPYQPPYPAGLHTLTVHGAPPERALPAAPVDPVVQDLPVPTLPGVTTLGQILDTGFRPSLDAILLGQGPGGVPLTAAVGDELCHMILAGRTGAGKTNIMRLLLVQVLAAGCQVYLCNPKYTVHHWKTGERWDLLARATAPGRAITDLDAICALIRHLATGEFATRKARFEAGQQPGTPIVLFLDELPAIIGNDPDLMDPKTGALSLLLRQGREFLIEIVICSQDVLVETMGGNSGLRGQFQTRYYGGGDETSKRVLLQPRAREVLPEPPGRGLLYLWAVPTGRQAQMVRVPLVTNADIERVLTASGAASQVVDAASWPVPAANPMANGAANFAPENVAKVKPEVAAVAISEDAKKALDLFLSGLSMADVVKTMRGVSSSQGATYQKALNEIQELLRQALTSHPA
jgi:hypothetical protein